MFRVFAVLSLTVAAVVGLVIALPLFERRMCELTWFYWMPSPDLEQSRKVKSSSEQIAPGAIQTEADQPNNEQLRPKVERRSLIDALHAQRIRLIVSTPDEGKSLRLELTRLGPDPLLLVIPPGETVIATFPGMPETSMASPFGGQRIRVPGSPALNVGVHVERELELDLSAQAARRVTLPQMLNGGEMYSGRIEMHAERTADGKLQVISDVRQWGVRPRGVEPPFGIEN